MARTYGVGIMGAGNISTAYMKLAPLFKGLEVRAIADIVPAAAKARGDEFGVKAMTPDELLKNSEVDVIVNLTIPASHYSVTMDALSAGKHVYSEKPLGINYAEGRKLLDAANKAGLRIGSAPDTFLGGSHQQARDIIDSKQLGKIFHGTAHMLSRGVEHWHPNPAFFYQPGAGPLLDMGPYYITDLVQLLGPVRRVTAFSGSARAHRVVSAPNSPILGKKVKVTTPTTIHGILEFHSGAIITLGTSFDTLTHGHHNIELYGTEGSIFVPDPNIFGGKIETADETGARTTVTPWDHPFGKANYKFNSFTDPQANYRSVGLADMMLAVGSSRTARCDISVALHVVDVMTSMLKAGETGKVITLTTTCERPKALKPKDAQAMLK